MDLDFLRQLSLYAIIGSAIILIIIEKIIPYDKNHKFFREGWFTDFFFYTIVQNYVLSILIFSYIIEYLRIYTGIAEYQLLSDWPIWLQFTFFLFTHDAYIYFFHRFQHRNKFFWRLHEAHHSPPAVDWLAGSRSHALEIIINQTIEFAPIILLGAAPEVVIYKGLIDAVWGMYIHSNIDVRSGKLQYIINGPEMHRWHHALDVEGIDKNFATKFAFWDFIFKTDYLPDFKPQKYGLPYKEYPISSEDTPLLQRLWDDTVSYVMQHVYSFRKFRPKSEEYMPLESLPKHPSTNLENINAHATQVQSPELQ
jgi:sterol desaturase/sphingolipid hydroxylase (fatty acid hydroxylase superfamily)